MRQFVTLLPVWLLLGGCYVAPGTPTPVRYRQMAEPTGGGAYYIYVPSYYSADRDWPLVVTLHGTNPWDDYDRQIREWDSLAEAKGFIVVAPKLQSPQGVLPNIRSRWFRHLAEDERRILALIDHVSGDYRVDPRAILLTGFSAGGYPMYHTGLRNPQRFSMLVARNCNSDLELFERIALTEAARKLPVRIYWGKADPEPIQDESWQAFRYLRNHGCVRTYRREIKGGHIRRPEMAYELWREVLPARHGQ
ncbi:MAG TPA: PHB depolymerase family esterase [Phycisphaerae bacterium]|nr:PHB depolymerase family esterase [Phycisphaerae bacterium]